MEQKEFLERFVPDFKERTKGLNIMGQIRLFPEALQNFADKICEEQCEICANIYQENLGHTQPDNYLYNAILCAEQPDIEEL